MVVSIFLPIFAIPDTSLADNDYADGSPTNDHVASVRYRRAGSTFSYWCIFLDSGYNGEVLGKAPFSGATWVNTSSISGSSVKWSANSSCI